jgi:hypothetical protein
VSNHSAPLTERGGGVLRIIANNDPAAAKGV